MKPRTSDRAGSSLVLSALSLCAALILLPAAAARAHPGEAGVGEADKAPRAYAYRLGEGMMPLLGRGFLGIELTRLTPELLAHFGVPAEAGVMVARVLEDGPAAAAGLAVGDIVTAIDGESVATPLDLARRVRRGESGEEVELEVYRDGRRSSFTVAVAERERRAVDLGSFYNWQVEGEGAPALRWQEGALPKTFTLPPPEVFEQLGERLQAIDWSDFSRRLESTPQDVDERLEQLEKRLAELMAQIEALSEKSP